MVVATDTKEKLLDDLIGGGTTDDLDINEFTVDLIRANVFKDLNLVNCSRSVWRGIPRRVETTPRKQDRRHQAAFR